MQQKMIDFIDAFTFTNYSFHLTDEKKAIKDYDILRDIIWLRALITTRALSLQRAAADIPSLCLKLITPDGLSF